MVNMSVYKCKWVNMSGTTLVCKDEHDCMSVYMSEHERTWVYMSEYKCARVNISVYMSVQG